MSRRSTCPSRCAALRYTSPAAWDLRRGSPSGWNGGPASEARERDRHHAWGWPAARRCFRLRLIFAIPGRVAMRTPNGMLAALGVGLATALVGACGPGFSQSNFIQPRLHLDRVIVRGVGLAGGNLDLVV